MLHRKRELDLRKFYPSLDDINEGSAQKAWRMATGCRGEKPCGLLPCSACTAAAKKLTAKRVRILHRTHADLEFIKMELNQTHRVCRLRRETFRNFIDASYSALEETELEEIKWVGIFSANPVCISHNRPQDGLDKDKCEFRFEVYFHLPAEHTYLWLEKLVLEVGEGADCVPSAEGFDPDIDNAFIFDQRLHQATRKAGNQFFFGSEHIRIDLAECIANN